MRTAFCFNIVGTITATEVLPCIGSEIGISDEIEVLTRAINEGRIAFEPSLKLLCFILGQVPANKVQKVVSNIPLDEELLYFIHTHKADSFLLTGMLDSWMQPISRNCGCELYASKSVVAGGEIKLEKLLNKGDAVSEIRTLGYERIVSIGNSVNDVPMLTAADVGIVFGGVRTPSPIAISVSDYIIHERTALCRMLKAL